MSWGLHVDCGLVIEQCTYKEMYIVEMFVRKLTINISIMYTWFS